MENKIKRTLFGADYYPEDWDESEIEYDLSMMKKAGINTVRIAEFAWHKMEPKEGEYDFLWLHKVVDRLGKEGIQVILGTPTATPPFWLIKKYPDMSFEGENGVKMSHGGRRHCCSNNAHYIEYTKKIVDKMGREFGNDENVIGWQIDNEIYSWGLGCFCETCQKKFHSYLKERFGSIEEINKRWNLNLFSQAYDEIDEIVPPRHAWHNPHLKTEWRIFQNDSNVNYVIMQAEILRKYTKVPIGTDVMPVMGMNYRKLFSNLDVVQFNHYNEPDNLWQVCFWFDYWRNLGKIPFWNTETATCWNGSTAISQSIKPEGFCRVNSFLPLALGGEANLYWLWRTHWAGHELTHGSVLDSSGRPMHIFGEVEKTAETFAKSSDFIRSTKVKTNIGFLVSSRNFNMLCDQPIVEGTSWNEVFSFYKPLLTLGLRPDVVDYGADLDKYELIFAPLMMTMEENSLDRRLENWVKNGGTLVIGPFSDIRNIDGAHYKHKPYGFVEELTGAKWCYGIPDTKGAIKVEWNGGENFSGGRYYELFESDGHELAKVTSGHSAIFGKSPVLDIPVGKGRVIILGTFPDQSNLEKLYKTALKKTKINLPSFEGNIIVSKREGADTSGVILCEYSGQSTAKYCLGGKYKDILTGKIHEEFVELEPYGVAVLEKV